jgi:hypothetical protein
VGENRVTSDSASIPSNRGYVAGKGSHLAPASICIKLVSEPEFRSEAGRMTIFRRDLPDLPKLR